MGKISVKRFSSPDEKRPFVAHGYVDVLSFGDRTVGRAVFEPGWKWQKDVGPLAGTKSCQFPHACYVVSGKMHIISDEGETADVGAGDIVFLEPGHDGWVIGNEACVVLDFEGMREYARPRAGTEAATAAP